MENKKIKFPIASVLTISSIMITVIAYLIMFSPIYELHITESVSSAIINICFFIPKLIFCGVLYRKKQDKILFGATCLLAIQALYYFVRYASFVNFFRLLGFVLIILMVGTLTFPQLEKYKNIAKKLYFLPALIFALIVLYIICKYIYLALTINFFHTFPFYLIKIGDLTWAIAVFFFLQWCFFPYAEEKPENIPEDTTTVSFNNETQYTDNAVLDYNEAYCGLAKHILLLLFGFGIWMYVWIYKTTKTLNKAPNSENYNPAKKLLLCMFVPFYTIYWLYKHGERVDKLNTVAGMKTDNANLYLILGIFIPILGCILMQDSINKLCVSSVSTTSTSAPVIDEKSTTEALKEYKSLLDAGVITQEEFDAKKRQLLNL